MDQDDVSGDDAFPTEQANSYPDRDGSGKGDVSRNARQMMQNKAAQQRYRCDVTAASGGVCCMCKSGPGNMNSGMHRRICSQNGRGKGAGKDEGE